MPFEKAHKPPNTNGVVEDKRICDLASPVIAGMTRLVVVGPRGPGVLSRSEDPLCGGAIPRPTPAPARSATRPRHWGCVVRGSRRPIVNAEEGMAAAVDEVRQRRHPPRCPGTPSTSITVGGESSAAARYADLPSGWGSGSKNDELYDPEADGLKTKPEARGAPRPVLRGAPWVCRPGPRNGWAGRPGRIVGRRRRQLVCIRKI